MKAQCEKCGQAMEVSRVIKTLVGESHADWEGQVATLTGILCNPCWRKMGKPPSFSILDGELLPENLRSVGDQLAEEHLRDLEAEQRSEEEEILAQVQSVHFNRKTTFVLHSPMLGQELIVFKPEWSSPLEAIDALLLFLQEIGKDQQVKQLMEGYGIQLRPVTKDPQV